MRARQDAVAETRERILGAAYELWAQRPYDRVTIGAIARSAGVSRQTVIRQFGTKDALAFAVVDWQKPQESAFRATEAGDIDGAIARLVGRYETMGDANVRMLEMSGRVPAIDYLLEVSRAGHLAWIVQTLLSGADNDQQLVHALYAATDVTVWKLLRRDLSRSREETEAIVLRLVRGVLFDPPARKE